MPRLKIIILDKTGDKLNVAMWADVPVERQPFYADPAKTSAWKDALAADNTALQTGAVVELLRHFDFPGGENLAGVKSELVAAWNGFQAKVTASNPWRRYGTVWDGASWTNGGVA